MEAVNASKDHPARILIVDDHAIVRYGIGVLLSGVNDLMLCGEAGTYDEALVAFRELRPDVAVIDLILQHRSGLDLIRELRENGVKIPLLVLSMHDEVTHAEKALRAGAQGYLMKEDADAVLIEALRTVLKGKLYVSDELHEKLLRSQIETDDDPDSGGVESFTEREREIFELIGK
ncbi:MAG: response regulator transcription factor, partial [Kiritimatiellaceae bacterium]|nr:response regulator transcription factor [Kiritimatiellaceae bacterium]